MFHTIVTAFQKYSIMTRLLLMLIMMMTMMLQLCCSYCWHSMVWHATVCHAFSFDFVLHSGNLFKLFHCTLNNVDDIFLRGFFFCWLFLLKYIFGACHCVIKQSVKKCITTIFETVFFVSIRLTLFFDNVYSYTYTFANTYSVGRYKRDSRVLVTF